MMYSAVIAGGLLNIPERTVTDPSTTCYQDCNNCYQMLASFPQSYQQMVTCPAGEFLYIGVCGFGNGNGELMGFLCARCFRIRYGNDCDWSKWSREKTSWSNSARLTDSQPSRSTNVLKPARSKRFFLLLLYHILAGGGGWCVKMLRDNWNAMLLHQREQAGKSWSFASLKLRPTDFMTDRGEVHSYCRS